MPSPSRMMMFLTLGPSAAVKGTTSKLPVASTFWPSACVASTLNSCVPGASLLTARTVAMTVSADKPLTQPVAQSRKAIGALTGLPSTRKRAATIF